MRGSVFFDALLVTSALGGCALLEHPEGGAPNAAGGTGPSGGAAGAPSDECPIAGAGRVDIRVTGLPEGTPAGLILRGPRGSQAIFESRVIEGIAGGPYAIDVARVAPSDPIVRSVYEYAAGETAFCLRDSTSHQVELSYRTVPTSHRLWINNDGGSGDLLAFAAASLSSTSEASPAVNASASAGRDLTFDAEGNLWSMPITSAEARLMRFERSGLESSGAKEADRVIDIGGITCEPALRAFSFDLAGALWVRTCGGGVVRLGPAELEASGEVTAPVLVENLSDSDSGELAFDILGNLWVVDDERVLRFDGPRLGAPGTASPEPDLSLSFGGADAGAPMTPGHLAFDGSGNLWVSAPARSALVRIAHADLQGTGSRIVTPDAALALESSARLDRPAFDESGGLWVALDQNRFGRLSPAQLETLTTEPLVPETIITSPSMGSANRMAFYPAPAGLPLYHRLQ